MIVAGTELQEFDEIFLSGVCTKGHPHVDLACVVSTLSKENDDGPESIKIWPVSEDSRHLDGKIWFRTRDILSVKKRYYVGQQFEYTPGQFAVITRVLPDKIEFETESLTGSMSIAPWSLNIICCWSKGDVFLNKVVL